MPPPAVLPARTMVAKRPSGRVDPPPKWRQHGLSMDQMKRLMAVGLPVWIIGAIAFVKTASNIEQTLTGVEFFAGCRSPPDSKI
eukprot:11782960-Alexandrium_andersonii.AAC.1